MEIVYFAYNQCDILEIRDILEFLELEAYDLSRVIESFVMNSTVVSCNLTGHVCSSSVTLHSHLSNHTFICSSPES